MMKTHYLPILALALCASCSTPPSASTQAVQARVAGHIRLVTYVGAALDMELNPENRAYYAISRESLAAGLRDPEFDQEKLLALLQDLPVKELKGSTGAIIINAGIILWQVDGGDLIELDQSQWIRSVTQALIDGLDTALAAGDVPVPKALRPPQ